MKKIWLAGLGGAVAGAVVSTQLAGPLLAQEAQKESSVYEQLDLFGNIITALRLDSRCKKLGLFDRKLTVEQIQGLNWCC